MRPGIKFYEQAALVALLLPEVAREREFALKGGTAINFYYYDLPRISVDIDLVFLPVKLGFDDNLKNIKEALERIRTAIRMADRRNRARISEQMNPKLYVRRGLNRIKIEVSPVMRGTVHPTEKRKMTPRTVRTLGVQADMTCVSMEEAFAGKLCAALSRQHPRDLFDVGMLYKHGGISDELFKTFLVYIASDRRTPQALLDPRRLDIRQRFERLFPAMCTQEITLAQLLEARTRLINDIQSRLRGPAIDFLLSLHDGEPDFGLIDRAGAEELPAVNWKLHNLEIFKHNQPDKHARHRDIIESLQYLHRG